MSARFNAKLSDTEWAAFQAGQARANRDFFMHNADTFKRTGSLDAMKTCVQAARDCNRRYLKAVADFAKANRPTRKRA